ncbi:L-threonine ammonia-lyase-like [Lineus longissimus]|uniref:L-threonine ammonia-lyase-like n=1 Tax=Lineus longissimus TaxID=88925 RepID=UPI002B4D2417
MGDISHLTHIPISEIWAARERIKDIVPHTPLLPLNIDQTDKDCKIYLKLENLLPTGAFKLRGSTNAILCLADDKLSNGVYTASAGNFGQGFAWSATKRGVPCQIIIPDHVPETKVTAMERFGGVVMKVPFDTWWKVIQEHRYDGMTGSFVHPGCDRNVIAGNGTMGLEILEQLPSVDAVICPYGSGGMTCGIASTFKALKPSVRVYACEVETAAPLAASLAAGEPKSCDYTPSFVDGIGGKSVLPEMWNLVSSLATGSIVSSLEETADALRTLILRNHVVAEGAGAASVAAALSGKAGKGNIVCVISGGNIDPDRLSKILQNEIPK